MAGLEEYPIFFRFSRLVAASVSFSFLLPSVCSQRPSRQEAFKCIQLIFDNKKSRSILPQVRLTLLFSFGVQSFQTHFGSLFWINFWIIWIIFGSIRNMFVYVWISFESIWINFESIWIYFESLWLNFEYCNSLDCIWISLLRYLNHLKMCFYWNYWNGFESLLNWFESLWVCLNHF